MNRKTGLTAIISILLTAALLGCGKSDTPPQVADDEILLQIQLDVKEDVGLLLVNYDADGSGGSGGTSNADKSLLKHDELILYTLEKAYFERPSDVINLSIQFTIITDYVDPNYDNIYPAEYTKPMSAIQIDASFGESYFITITGDKASGYTAVQAK